MFNITPEEIQKFIEVVGPVKANRDLSLLGRIVPNLDVVFGTEIGKEIMKDDMDRFEILKRKIEDVEASPEEEAEYLYLKNRRFPRIVNRLKIFIEKTTYIKSVIGVTK